jgi:hypothetical protein
MSKLNEVLTKYQRANQEAREMCSEGNFWAATAWAVVGRTKDSDDNEYIFTGDGPPQQKDLDSVRLDSFFDDYQVVWIEGRTDMWLSRKDYKNDEPCEDTMGDYWEVYLKGSMEDIA